MGFHPLSGPCSTRTAFLQFNVMDCMVVRQGKQGTGVWTIIMCYLPCLLLVLHLLMRGTVHEPSAGRPSRTFLAHTNLLCCQSGGWPIWFEACRSHYAFSFGVPPPFSLTCPRAHLLWVPLIRKIRSVVPSVGPNLQPRGSHGHWSFQVYASRATPRPGRATSVSHVGTLGRGILSVHRSRSETLPARKKQASGRSYALGI